jgi:hypothetical protein
MSTPNLDDQVAALGISFIELAKMLGQKQLITVTQLANAIETSAKNSKANVGTSNSVSELARKLR